ncbi:hypothetical protein ACMSEX_24895, partial [Bacteroides thetaiotaomicron]|uniref:hypothetical protein n=1 Tax=Bacteroides thetaiotaomicron TaxID=818 RepID=UPI0039C3722A
MNEFIGKFANDIFFSLSVWATFVRTSSIPDDATTGYSEMPGYGKRYSGGCKGQLTGNWTARLTSQLAGS